MQTPLTAAITGLVDASTLSITCSRLGCASAAGVLNSLMSAPPENTLPVPVITTARTSSSRSARPSPSIKLLRVVCPNPLTGGLSICSTATSPRFS